MTPYQTSIPFGFCQCGCGQMTPIAKKTRKESSHVRGQHTPYCFGHKKPYGPKSSQELIAQPDDPSIRYIPLTGGQVAKVSTHRFEELSKRTWSAHWDPRKKSFYARTTFLCSDGAERGRRINMHRLILGLSAGDPRQIDHINGDTLDNRDENIRICSAAENARNRGKNRNKIGYKGVKRAHKSARFTATIYVEGKNIHLGTRDTAEEAALLYDEAAIHHFGEFAHPNFPHS